MEREETMGVLSSAEFIVQNSKSVSIEPRAIESAVDFVIEEFRKQRPNERDLAEPPGLSEEEVLEWLFLLDTLNFCYWSDDEKDLFEVEYKGKRWTEYRAMRNALCRAIEGGIPMHKPAFYGDITLHQLKEIFKSCNGTEIPLLPERLDNLHQAADVLHKRFNGKVTELIKESDESVQKLVELLTSNFPSYQDFSFFKGRKVSFFKRAQLFTSSVWYRFNGKTFGKFNDINTLTMFADYRVPQLLVYQNILKYSDPLMDMLKKGIHINKDSEYEVEIRGATIWAVELICKGVRDRLNADPALCPDLNPSNVYPCTVDFILWEYASKHTKELSNIPIHKTITIFY